MTPVHWLGDLLRQGLLQVPLGAVRVMFVGLLAGLLVWVLRLPPEATTPPGGATRWDENLKAGACLALIVQILIYWWC